MKGYCGASACISGGIAGLGVDGEWMRGRPWTANNASSKALPKKKGFMDVVCNRARIDVFKAIASCAESVSDLAITGMTLVRDDRRCMNSISLEISWSSVTLVKVHVVCIQLDLLGGKR